MELLFKEEVFQIVGAAMEVHRVLGYGFLESVYHEALSLEFETRGIPFETERSIEIQYKEKTLKRTFSADFLCFDRIILEMKAQASLSGKDEAQLLNYLKAIHLRVGVLVNFGSFPKLEWKRMVL